jgi:hypothetical protein
VTAASSGPRWIAAPATTISVRPPRHWTDNDMVAPSAPAAAVAVAMAIGE